MMSETFTRTPARSPDSVPTAGMLGTFGGVFTPSILTILGLVLFLRVAYVVGSVGLVRALLILGLSTAVAVLTTISLSVVATNMTVRGGGEYFLISRTLGIEFGGAVGVVLYLAISVSIAFYAIGFAEALVAALGSDRTVLIQLVAVGLIALLTLIAYVGADLATRLQYVVMALLVLALVSFFAGVVGDFDGAQFSANLGQPTDGSGFWEAFAVFFPAVTGFSQGLAMSGDLRTPSRSITRGTFAAVGLSTLVYVAAIVLLAGAAPAAVLVADTTEIMGRLSVAERTMLIGVLAATLSSALASSLGAPRILQRLAQDRVLPRIEPFAVGAGPAENPRRALGLSAIVALVMIAAGDINAIAPIISMFFLVTYGIINYATYFEIKAGSTGFRPRFQWYDHRASLAGTVACAGAIVAINPLAGVAAAGVLVALFVFLRNRDSADRWVDSAGSHHYTRARRHLHSLSLEPHGDRDWRPYALAFAPRDPVRRHHLLNVASWLEGGAGFLTAVRLVKGTGPVWRERADEIEADLGAETAKVAPGSYARVLAVADPAAAIPVLVQSQGVGSLKPNLTIFGIHDLSEPTEDSEHYGEMLRSCVRHGTNVAIVNTRDDAWERFAATPGDQRTLAVWWADDQVGQLLTLLAWLTQRHEAWRHSTITVYVPADDTGDPEHDPVHVASILEGARIDASVVAVDSTPAGFIDAMSGATFALAPLRVRRKVATGPFETSMRMIVESLPLSVLTLASETLDIDAQPDESQLAAFARARDEADAGESWVEELDAAAAMLLVEAEASRIARDGATTDAERAQLALRVADAEEAASVAYRKFIDARVRQFARRERASRLDPHRVGHELDPDIWTPANG